MHQLKHLLWNILYHKSFEYINKLITINNDEYPDAPNNNPANPLIP